MSLLLIAFIMGIGVTGLRLMEHMSFVDAFYYMSMIATAQGPTFEPRTAAAKLFVSFMAFVSVGSAVASLGFLFGPFFGQLWRLGVEKIEERK